MDCLQDWPEPVVRVQSLSDSGANTIPGRYVKPPSDRPSSAPCADLSIPVVDLASLAGDGTVDCAAVVQAVSSACRDWGFFQVVNHGVDPGLMRRMRQVWRGFFHLPMEAKQVYANSPKTYEGYGSRLGIQKGAILDWGDYYFLHVLPQSLKSHTKWPALPSTLRETTDEYGHELIKLCERVMKVLSLGLGLNADFLQKAFGGDDAGACMRVNFYPKCPQPDLTLGLSSHSDPGGITVLLADDRVKGLQVRRGDAWVTVQPVPDSFIINVGDQVQVLSNATYKSVEHRVVVNSEAERLSFAFFYNPKSDLLIGPAPELVTPDRPALYQPMTFDEYRLYIRRKGPRGKSQVESLKAAR
ncbi:probable 2-oxoglutarate-dependent dioxygenase At3g111800 isoform X2 [Phoenix dactylifera]|uniref:Probable 2-oxoglutarate-dependent dioxygenase At3g111800 isoform X2 n=1 Tax=Phoenix dactylifera TaxID=42345 RepID=A0A8B7C0C9_PHODC|nr:probable 2-oxoglutarate-dependent dioxygenase At3g111800 isoform X2 [Phoenix dactylifera]